MGMEERLLTIDEAAEILNTSTDWLYRHHAKLPFTVRLSPRQVRFSLKGLERYIEEKQDGHAKQGRI
jgi:predicted DNA-binding transcriptional regulator AlpA